MKKSIIPLILITFLILNLSFVAVFRDLSFAKSQNGEIIFGDDSGNADYENIQDAINAAKEHYTIYVYNGIYYENIRIDKNINLVGENKNSTIIDGNNYGNAITLLPSSNYVNITGFTIRNSGNGYKDAGIDIDSDYAKIAGNIIKECKYGIINEFWGHNCKIYSNTIKKNTIGIFIYSINPNNNLFYHNNFIENNINAYDESSSVWSYNEKGNYWHDYKGVDEDGDGIGDTPYYIPGGTAEDKNPLMKEYETPGFEIFLVIFSLIFIIVIFLFKKK